MNKVSPKGIVEPTEMSILCNKIRILLENESNTWTYMQRIRLQAYTKLQRCFTEAEAEDIGQLFYMYQRKNKRANERNKQRKELFR